MYRSPCKTLQHHPSLIVPPPPPLALQKERPCTGGCNEIIAAKSALCKKQEDEVLFVSIFWKMWSGVGWVPDPFCVKPPVPHIPA